MKKILIFDAYPSIRKLLAEELAAEGYVTISLGKAESLMDAVEKFGPDLIVLDLYLRGGVHFDLLEALKNRFPAVPVLLFTGFHPQELPRFKQADGWVQKSFLFEELKEKIKGLLEQRKRSSLFSHPILAKDLNPINLSGASPPEALPRDH